jgi:hypothetical protein
MAILIQKFVGMDYKSWSLEVEILMEQEQILGIADGPVEALEDVTELESWRKQHGIALLTILLAMERSLQQQYGIEKDAQASWNQLKEGQQVEGEGECLGFARRDVSCEVRRLQVCAELGIKDRGVRE